MSKNGKFVVSALAGLFAVAIPLAAAHAADPPKAADKKVHCEGANSCAGKSECKSSANNSCSGKNGCAGKGWVSVTEKECKDKNGKVVADDAKKK
jgi:hypothetical protein